MRPMLYDIRKIPEYFSDLIKKKGSREETPANRIGTTIPAVNVRENDKECVVEVAAPGLSKKDFNVSLKENDLVISSEKEVSNEDKKKNFRRSEFRYTSFQRSFRLPEYVDKDKIKAKHKNGVLYVIMPKKETAEKPEKKSIDIE